MIHEQNLHIHSECGRQISHAGLSGNDGIQYDNECVHVGYHVLFVHDRLSYPVRRLLVTNYK